jgi:hypothetical protein
MNRPLTLLGCSRGLRPAAPVALCLLILLLTAAPTIAADAATDSVSLRHWGFGWDPGDSGRGLTLRYRFTSALDLAASGGPEDYRNDSESTRWDDDNEVVDDGNTARDDYRREQGWVRLSGGYRFWSQKSLAVSGVLGVTYRWSHTEERYREYRQYNSQTWDYYNTRDLHDVGAWTYTLGVRPSWAITSRLQVEFEAGIEFRRSIDDGVRETWWDSFPDSSRDETTLNTRDFSDYGGFELYRLKFIFWF